MSEYTVTLIGTNRPHKDAPVRIVVPDSIEGEVRDHLFEQLPAYVEKGASYSVEMGGDSFKSFAEDDRWQVVE
jgi:hypothetical protein